MGNHPTGLLPPGLSIIDRLFREVQRAIIAEDYV